MKLMYKVVCEETGEVYSKYYPTREAAWKQAKVVNSIYNTNNSCYSILA